MKASNRLDQEMLYQFVTECYTRNILGKVTKFGEVGIFLKKLKGVFASFEFPKLVL